MPQHRLGHCPDPSQHSSYVPVSRLIGTSGTVAPRTNEDMLPLVDVVFDQPGQSCVGHGIAGAIHVRRYAERAQAMVDTMSFQNAVMNVLGEPEVAPSPLFIFGNACKRGHYDGQDGSYPVDAWTAARDYGYCGVDAWPDDEAHMNRVGDDLLVQEPDDDAYRLAADQRTVQQYRFTSRNGQLQSDVMSAIDQRYPVTLALQVDQAYMDATTNVWSPAGEVLGGHYVYAVGYTPQFLWTVGSYGRSFGDLGFVRVAWSAIMNSRVTSDLYAVTFADPVEPVRA